MQIKSIVLPVLLISLILPLSALATSEYTVYVNRTAKTLTVKDKYGQVSYRTNCGIGRGGLNAKRSMSDYVTPTGEFKIDIILYENREFNRVSDDNTERYKDKLEYSNLLSSKEGLSGLFNSMNGIDFDNNGKPDNAYGTAYLGLTSDNALTGPKMQTHGKTPYWFSIAIHGTPDEKNIGRANSGGCIHVSEKDLSWLIENRIVGIGTRVTITDTNTR